MRTIHVRIALALAAAATLLATSSAGYAAWRDAGSGAAPSRSLAVGTTTVAVTSPGGTPRTVDGTPVTITPGDSVTLRVPVTIRTQDPISTLTVQPGPAKGDEALADELQSLPASVKVAPQDGGPALKPVTGDPAAHTVTSASNGHTYLVEWTITTRTTRDGREPGPKNAWGSGPTSLQGQSVGPRGLLVRLTPGSATPGSMSPSASPSPSTAATGAA